MTKRDYEDIVEYIMENIKLLDIIESYNLKIQKESEGRYTMICPFHMEDTPSLKIYQNSGGRWTFFCFGCGAGYSVIDFMKMYENIGFMEVINRYKQNVGATGETIFQKILNQNKGPVFDLPNYMMSSKFRLGLILREYLKSHNGKEDFTDDCFYQMDNFFESVENLNKERIDAFEEGLLERINNEVG